MTANKKLQAKIISRKDAYKGFFKVEELEIEMDRHDGVSQTVTRVNFERGHAVGVLAYDPKTDQVLLINEMRPGMLAAGENPFNDSLLAGMIDKGETVLQAAKREGHEETGQDLGNLIELHSGAYVSAGGTSERLALVYGTFDATTAGGVHGKAGEGEDIKSVLVSADEFIARGKDGRLKDLKSLIFSFWLAAHREELRDPDAAAPTPEKPVDKKIGDVFAPAKPKQMGARIVERETLYEGEFAIEGLVIEMDRHDGTTQELKRLNYDRGNSIAMIGYDPKRDEVVLVNEMRSGPLAAGDDAYTDSVPAAILKDGEDPEAAAVSQMKRKTGLDLTDTFVIHPGVFPTSGGSSEKITLIAGTIDSTGADGVVNGRPKTEDSFRNIVLKSDEFIDRAEKGELKDLKSLAFAFWLANNRKALQDKAAAKDAPSAKIGKDAASKKIAGIK